MRILTPRISLSLNNLQRLHRLRALAWLVALTVLSLVLPSQHRAATSAQFTKVVVDANQTPWGKALGDINGDGNLDMIAGFNGGNVYWYQYPAWQRYAIGPAGGDDLQVADMNGDGALDAITNGGPIVWFENPRGQGGNAATSPWTAHVIDSAMDSHDLLVSDVNADGRPDVAIRRELGPTFLYLQGSANSWTKVSMPNAEGGNSLAFSDVNVDGKVDIVENGYWLQQPANPVTGNWVRHTFATWVNGSSVMIADMNHDGRDDVVLSPSESAGRISWFEKPIDPVNGTWVEHLILNSVSFVHRVRVGDFNNDGNPDVAFAEMDQAATDRVGINYANDPQGLSWTLQVLATTAGHNIAIGDVDGDGDLDILNANWTNNTDLEIWRNGSSNSLSLDSWHYTAIDSSKPDISFGLTFGDLNRDGLPDIVTGREWYKNPGADITGTWVRTDLAGSYDAMLVTDVDGTGQPSIIAQVHTGSNNAIYWLKPTTSAAATFNSTLVGTIPFSRDGTSQGYALVNINATGKPQVVFSSDSGIYYFTIPADPALGNWPRVQVNTNGTQEGIAASDINGDGGQDLVGSTHTSFGAHGTQVVWWENPKNGAGSWTAHAVGNTDRETDRVRVADINRDGRPDIVVTDSDYNLWSGSVYWFEQTTAGTWIRRTVAANLSASVPSMDVGDFNKDGKIDIVIGQHGGSNPLQTIVYQNVGDGASWTAHLTDTNKESHQGTQAFDLDNDSDLDVVSIAYSARQFVHVWRNDAIVLTGGNNTPPTVATPAAAAPNPVQGTTTTLTVLGADDGSEGNLNYTWATSSAPAAVTFSANGTNAAKNTVATFTKAGNYSLQVTIRDTGNLTVVSSVGVTVSQTLTGAVVAPTTASVVPGGTRQFTATANDQFGAALTSQPAFAWSVTGGGTINTTGLFTAGSSAGGPFTVRATSGTTSGTASVTVTTDAQTLTSISVAPSTASVAPGGTQQFTATARDQFGVAMSPQPSVVWSVTGGGAISGSGLFNAGSSPGGPYTVTATSGSVSGTATVTVTSGVGGAGGAGVAYVQGFAATNDGSASSITQSFAAPNTAGDLIVAAVSWGNSATLTCADTQGNTYAVATAQYDPTNSQSLAICYASKIKAGANTVTATFSGSAPFRRFAIHEYSGVMDTNALDAVATNLANGTAAVNGVTSATATTTSAGDLIFGAVMDDTGVTTIAPGSGFTERLSVNNEDLVTEDAVQMAAGSIATTYTFGSAHRYLAQMAAFRAASSGPTNAAPIVATAAEASPSPTTGTTTTLSVLGADDGGEGSLNYMWVTTGAPPAAVTFSPNGTNAAKNTVATFTKAGSYSFHVTIQDPGNLTTVSDVSVTVSETLTGISVAPASASVASGATQQFTATANDQFGAALTSPPAFTWSVTGEGTISETGLFTAGGSAGGPFTVAASSGAISGTAAVTVTAANTAPTVMTSADVSPNPTTGTTANPSVLGADDGGESNLSYTWGTSSGPAAVTFSANGTNAAKNPVATFTKAGNYTLQVTIRDAGNLTATSGASVMVSQTLTSIAVVPAAASVATGGTLQFTATANDQFGAALTSPPAFTWSVTGEGTISETGLFTAGGSAGGPFTVAASSGAISGTAAVTVTAANTAPTVMTSADVSPNPTTGTTANPSVLGADDGGESNLSYTWGTSSGPAAVTFSANGTNAAKNPVATFTKAGNYSLQVTIRDAGNLTATSGASVMVSQTLTSIAVVPAAASVAMGGTLQFTATSNDQFGSALTSPPAFTWSVTGGGTISETGLFTAGSSAGGPFTVRATSGTTSGTASVTVTGGGTVVPAYVQGSTATNDTGASSIASAFTSANTANNLIVAAVSWGNNASVTCSDSQGNAYVVATTQYDSTNNQALAICYAVNVRAGANTVTATFSGATGFRRILIHEYANIALSDPVDVVAKNLANGTTTVDAITSTAGMTTTSGNLIFGAVMDDTGTTSITAGSGFTQRLSVNNKDLVSEDQVQVTAGSIAATHRFGVAHRYLAQMVAFKPR